MGTSSPTSGSGSGTPLVPSWLDGPGTGPLPGGDGPRTAGDDTGGDGQGQQPGSQDGNERPPIPPAALPGRFRSARTNFSRFARSGGSDQRALRRAVRDYVRRGMGGSRYAVSRMGSSRAAASNALGIIHSLQRHGVQETLRRLNLENLSGRGVQDIFIGLTEVICRDGGPVDEAIARDAWLETIATLDRLGIDDLDTLSSDQIKEIFLSFIAHTIEVRLYQEIGVNGFEFAEDLDAIDGFDSQFRDLIERSVRDSFTGDLAQLSEMSDQNIRDVVHHTYLEAWDLLQLLGDREG